MIAKLPCGVLLRLSESAECEARRCASRGRSRTLNPDMCGSRFRLSMARKRRHLIVGLEVYAGARRRDLISGIL